MKFFLRRLYSFWCYFWFLGFFMILFPFFFLFLQRPQWYRAAHYLNRLWGHLFFPISFLPITTEFRSRLEEDQTYVFCANHTSYLDIAAMGVVLRKYYAFIGKASIAKVPLFGYMFRRLHIPVNRESRSSGFEVVQRAIHMLHHGRSIVIFPEGGIKSKHLPRLAPFKDGAFRMAIQAQVPVVPITFPWNWLILPDDGKLLFRRHAIKAIIHEPIPTAGLTMEDVDSLRKRTFEVIEAELHRYFPHDAGQLLVSEKR
jgi:1-acyl-sn-glycerol-3-phosphate acyltransferase